MNLDHITRQCKHGCAHWPDTEAYEYCPGCGGQTRRYRGIKPLTEDEAQSRIKHIEFDRFYDEQWTSPVEVQPDEQDEFSQGLRALLSA